MSDAFDPESDVKDFHLKHDFPVGHSVFSATRLDGLDALSLEAKSFDKVLQNIAKTLSEHATDIERYVRVKKEYADFRALRVSLLCEELGEVLSGMAARSDVETFDGLVDLAYVTIGTCVAFGYPFKEGFRAVHTSNMTKEVRSPGLEDEDPRLREKGQNYNPVDLLNVLAEHRKANS